jgi:hypothetical protein
VRHIALHGRGNGGHHADAKPVAKAGADFSALGFKSFVEGERVEPCQGCAARIAEQAGGCASPFHRTGVQGLQ